MLRGICAFLKGLVDPGTFYSSDMSVKLTSWGTVVCSVELSRRDTSTVGGGAVTNSRAFHHTFEYDEMMGPLDICRALVACPSWTQGMFVFSDNYIPPLELDDLIHDTFSLLRSSPSLPSLDIQMLYQSTSYTRHLPTILCENPFLETLAVKNFSLKNPKIFALCFSRNSVLKSCTLPVEFKTLDDEQWEVALPTFTTSSETEAKVALKELVLRIHYETYVTHETL